MLLLTFGKRSCVPPAGRPAVRKRTGARPRGAITGYEDRQVRWEAGMRRPHRQPRTRAGCARVRGGLSGLPLTRVSIGSPANFLSLMRHGRRQISIIFLLVPPCPTRASTDRPRPAAAAHVRDSRTPLAGLLGCIPHTGLKAERSERRGCERRSRTFERQGGLARSWQLRQQQGSACPAPASRLRIRSGRQLTDARATWYRS